MTVTLDGRLMSDRAAAHEHLKERLGLPAYYGKNLDALYDVLTERAEALTIVLEHAAALDDYGIRIMNTLYDAANNNPVLVIYKKDC